MIIASPGQAESSSIDVPRGTVGEAAYAIGRQAGVSIAFRDNQVIRRKSAAIRGRMDAATALTRLAKSSGLRLRRVGPRSYVLLAQAPRPPASRLPLPPKTAPVRPATPAPAEQDIVVTASKRDLRSKRFAGLWTRIDGDEFNSIGVAGAEAIEARSVGFSSTHLGAGRNKLFIRGIADSSFSGPTQSPVGQYIGDMRTGYAGPDPDLRLVDMQAVEILEGPQGTLYGSGALGGIILLKPNMPRFGEQSGSIASGASATWHGDVGYDVSGTFNLPVGQSVAIRAVGYRSTEGGYIDNRATGERDINRIRIDGGRATLSAEVSPGWLIDLTGIAQRIDGDDSQYADREGSKLSRDSLVDQPFSSDFALAGFVIRNNSGAVRFRSTTGVTQQAVDERFDASLGDRVRQLDQSSKARAVSNETRLWRPMADGYGWLVGFSTIVHRYTVSRDVTENAVTVDLAGVENKVRETTLFGETGIELLPNLEASIGARLTHSSLSGSGEHLSPLAHISLAGSDTSRTELRLLPSAALLARPTDSLTVYARYQQGFRPGGLSIANDAVSLYRKDQLGTAEVGFRFGSPGSSPIDLQGSVTRSKWTDIQADFIDGGGLPVTSNIGDGRVWTLTLNGGVGITPSLRFEAGVAWNDGKITSPSPEYGRLAEQLGTMRIPNIARVVARAELEWRHDLGRGRKVEANAYARYTGRSRLGVGPILAEAQGDYLDSGFSLRVADDRRALSLAVTNITDAVGNRFAFGAPLATGVDQLTPLRPRTVRLGVEINF